LSIGHACRIVLLHGALNFLSRGQSPQGGWRKFAANEFEFD
jgi:hypothetical protein